MCGIFGALGCEGGHHRLEPYAKRLNHRGPDGFGSHYDPGCDVYLAHCRLSIIDLSDSGAQPMSSGDDQLWLTFNGEIYNFRELREELISLGYRFKSHSDSEVIIHAYDAWGKRCLERLSGMFAFAIWDNGNKELFIARDRLGIKPLYYAHIGGRLLFASEPKALIGLYGLGGARIHAEALKCYLGYRYVSGEQSIWQDIRRLLPGHYITYKPSSDMLGKRCYWRIDPYRHRGETEALDDLESILHDSVAQHLISDVSIGSFLSGGIDSTVVTGVAASQKPNINTFSIGFRGSDNNECETASVTATLFGTHHTNEMVSADNFQQMERVFDYFDEPLADTSIFPSFLVCQAARKHVKVALSGDGGDELFAGYRWQHYTVAASLLKRIAFKFGPLLRMIGAGNAELGRRCDVFDHYLRMTSPGFSFPEMRALFPDLLQNSRGDDEAYLYRRHFIPGLEPYKQWQLVDAATFLVDNNLTKMDRTSMANSLEVRVPLLDHRLVEFAFSLPDRLRVQGNEQKYLLRKLVGRLGAGHILEQPKQGFSCPVHRFWPMDAMEQTVRNGEMVRSGILDAAALEWTISDRAAYNYDYKIWLLAVLEKWFANWAMGSMPLADGA